jgi:hypothetical protein
MLYQAENKVKIEGILSEINIEPTSFKKNGIDQEALRGNILVKVNQTINGQEKELVIPVNMFAPKVTNKGTPNPAYNSIQKIKNEFVSIAAAGNEEMADRVRITGAEVRMNEYFSQDGRLISFPRIHASFVNKIKKEECRPEASFELSFAVANMAEEMDRNGDPTDRYLIKTIVPQYGGKVDVIPLVAESEKVINAITTYWEVGRTFKAHGKLDFSSTTEVTLEESGFGDPIEKIRTINRSDLVITGGSQESAEGDAAYDKSELDAALAERKARLDAQKDKDMSKASQRKAPANTTANGFDDLGF